MATQAQLDANWNDLKGKIKQKWGQITDQDLTEIEGNFDQLVALVQRKTGEAQDQVEQAINCILSSSQSTVHQATDAMRYAVDEVQTRARETYQGAIEMVRRRPAESVAVAFGSGILAGVIVGLLLRSK